MVLNDDNHESRRFVESCYRTTSTLVNPIVDWIDGDVWEFLRHYGCESNPLYKCGEKRIGCIGCPLAGYHQMKSDFIRYPAYKTLYIHAFDRMIERRIKNGLSVDGTWRDGESVFKWRIGEDPNQLTMFDLLEEGEQIELWG